jgi:hypothetical protein
MTNLTLYRISELGSVSDSSMERLRYWILKYGYTAEGMNEKFVEMCERRQHEYGKRNEPSENRTGEVASCCASNGNGWK